VLLLDEADVFLRKRSLDHHHNTLVSVFLRKLEYYQGIMFLTTNRVADFDDAIESRIHLGVKYKPLGLDTRTVIWESFLKTANPTGDGVSRKEIEELAQKPLNGRQVESPYYLQRRIANRSSYSRSKILSKPRRPLRLKKGLSYPTLTWKRFWRRAKSLKMTSKLARWKT
jgi:hypothetical protein